MRPSSDFDPRSGQSLQFRFQILTLLYRVLPELSPEEIDDLLSAFPSPSFRLEALLPPSAASAASSEPSPAFEPLCHSFFDVLLLLVAKAMTFHVKVKASAAASGVRTAALPRVPAWWWRGRPTAPGLAQNVARLLRDLLEEASAFGPVLRGRCEAALVRLFHNLGRLPAEGRTAAVCARLPCVFVCAAACCLLQGDLCKRIDGSCESGERTAGGAQVRG